MSEQSKVLSTEEVDALLKVTQEKGVNLTEVVGTTMSRDVSALNPRALKNITELTWSECEKILTSFLRKKVLVKSSSAGIMNLGDAVKEKAEKHVFSVFKMLPSGFFAVVVSDMPLLHQATNFLFGGQTNDSDPVGEAPGKIGKIISEKLSQLCMEGFTQACKEYGSVAYETIKTVTLPNLITKLSMDDQVYSMELSVMFGEVQTSLTIIVAADFLYEFIPVGVTDIVPIDSETWRSAIEMQVVDSYVTVSISLPEISIAASELVNLKNGALLSISDPTAVYVCLNNTKLFSGTAGQANSNRVVKIINEI